MKVEAQGVETWFNVCGYAIGGLFLLGHIGFEYFIPENKNGTEIFVYVFIIRAVVNAVIGGCYEYQLENPGKPAYIFSMLPELKEHRYLVNDKNDDGVKAT